MRMFAAAIAVAVTAAPVLAQQAEENTYGYATPEEAVAAFNLEQAAFARKQLAENAASQRAHDEAERAREAEIRRQRNAQDAANADYEEAKARWRADVAACEAGECAKD